MKDTVIAILVYKNRYTELIENINKVLDKYDVILFAQSNDDKLEEYEKYRNNVTDIICVNADNIAKKRQAIYDKCYELGYKYMFELDDDLKWEGKYIDESCKRQTSNSYKYKKIECEKLFDELLNKMKEHNAGMAAFMLPFYIGFGQPNDVTINRKLNAGQFILFDLEQLHKNNIKYKYLDMNGTEDICFMLDTMISGINVITLQYMSYGLCNNNFFHDTNKSSSQFDNHYGRYYLILWDNINYNIPISIDKRGVLHRRIRWDKYFNISEMPKPNSKRDKVVHEMIMNYYNEHHTVDETITKNVIDYLMDDYNKSHNK